MTSNNGDRGSGIELDDDEGGYDDDLNSLEDKLNAIDAGTNEVLLMDIDNSLRLPPDHSSDDSEQDATLGFLQLSSNTPPYEIPSPNNSYSDSDFGPYLQLSTSSSDTGSENYNADIPLFHMESDEDEQIVREILEN